MGISHSWQTLTIAGILLLLNSLTGLALVPLLFIWLGIKGSLGEILLFGAASGLILGFPGPVSMLWWASILAAGAIGLFIIRTYIAFKITFPVVSLMVFCVTIFWYIAVGLWKGLPLVSLPLKEVLWYSAVSALTIHVLYATKKTPLHQQRLW